MRLRYAEGDSEEGNIGCQCFQRCADLFTMRQRSRFLSVIRSVPVSPEYASPMNGDCR